MSSPVDFGAPMAFTGANITRLGDSDAVALFAGRSYSAVPTAPRTYLLPLLSSTTSGTEITVQNLGAFQIALVAVGGDTINDALFVFSLGAGQTANIESKGPEGASLPTWFVSAPAPTPGGSRLAINPTPTIGGTPFAPTYTAIFDEAIQVFDGGGFPTTFASTLPDISTASPGDQIGMLLIAGNPSTAITFSPVVTDQIIDPATGAPVGAPGVPLVLPAGTYASPVWLVWEAVQSAGGPASPQWQYIGDRASGSAAGRLDEVLAAGPNTNGQSLFLTQADLLGFDSRTSPLGTPASAPTFGTFGTDIQRGAYYREEVLASGSGIFVDLATPIFTRSGGGGIAGDIGNKIHVRITAARRQNTALFADNIMCVLEEIWNVNTSGTWTQLEVLVASSSAAANFQLAGVGDDLFLQMLRDVTSDFTAKYHVTYHASVGSHTA